jgi:MFS transporter, PHS family, inorganic phosphate transporter
MDAEATEASNAPATSGSSRSLRESGSQGRRLSDERIQILEKLLQIQKLNNHDIAFALSCDERTVRRRRLQFLELGKLINKAPDVSKNAEKLKPQHFQVLLAPAVTLCCCWMLSLTTEQKLQEWLKDHEDVLLEDMQQFLQSECGLNISISTISRQLKRANDGSPRTHGAKARLKAKREREAEGRQIDFTLNRPGEAADEPASEAVVNTDTTMPLVDVTQMLPNSAAVFRPLEVEDQG